MIYVDHVCMSGVVFIFCMTATRFSRLPHLSCRRWEESSSFGAGLDDLAAYSYTLFDILSKPNLQHLATRAVADAGCSTCIVDQVWLRQWPDVKYENVPRTPIKGLKGIVALN